MRQRNWRDEAYIITSKKDGYRYGQHSTSGNAEFSSGLARFESDGDFAENRHILPFQVAYAVSIHKAQGLEYDSVKIVIADETEEKITHNIFYTAITRARKELMIYWSPEVCNRILKRIRPSDYNKDYFLLKAKNNL